MGPTPKTAVCGKLISKVSEPQKKRSLGSKSSAVLYVLLFGQTCKFVMDGINPKICKFGYQGKVYGTFFFFLLVWIYIS